MRIQLLALTLLPVAYGQTAGKCADLLNFKIPGVAMVITKAETVAAEPGKASLPSHCEAEGMIDQRTGAGGKTYGIGFAIALPDNWNDRFLFQGGGGFNGTVRPPLGAAAAGDHPALARGFAVVSTDTGHQGNDRTFFQDQQAGLDFAYVAVGRVAVIAKQIVAHYYGQPAKYSYFAGCSTGGREAMTMTQRYPDYFDGVIAGDPAMRTGYAEIGRTWTTVAFNQIAPKDDAGKLAASPVFSDGDKKLVVDGLLNACDAKDGLKDGMIFNAQACKFDPVVLTCRGSKTDACLSAQQVGALKKAFSGPRNLHGDLVYPPSAYDAGMSLPGVLRGPTLATEIDVDAPDGGRARGCDERVDRYHLDILEQFFRARREAAVLSRNERYGIFAAGYHRLLPEDEPGERRHGSGAGLEPAVSGAGHGSLPGWRGHARRFRPADGRGRLGGEGDRSGFRHRDGESVPGPEPPAVRLSPACGIHGPGRSGRREELRLPRIKSTVCGSRGSRGASEP